jgi:hypothetical protein
MIAMENHQNEDGTIACQVLALGLKQRGSGSVTMTSQRWARCEDLALLTDYTS